MNPVRVELMASAAGTIGGVTWHHLFLVAADAGGRQEYLRAGPEALPIGNLFGRKTQHGDALEEYEPPVTGPYGVITFSSGSYEPGGIDFDPAAANVPLASGPATAVLWDEVHKAAQALQDEQIPYDPAGKGANWALMEALKRCGVQPSLPPKRWAPGVSRPASDSAAPSGPTRRVGQASVVA
jgi:hypothetical protein